MVLCGFHPTGPSEYDDLRKSIEKLNPNDSSVTFEPQTRDALGFGSRCGSLGLSTKQYVVDRDDVSHSGPSASRRASSAAI